VYCWQQQEAGLPSIPAEAQDASLLPQAISALRFQGLQMQMN